MEEKTGKLFVISGPSGVGKGTLLKQFLACHDEYRLSVSTTTRNPRPTEENGVDYFFTSKEQFLSSVKHEEFLEWAEFSGNYYGTKRDFVQGCLDGGEDLILEIDVQGALQVKRAFSDAVLVFVLPPGLDELESRLRGRNTETEESIARRLQIAASEIEISYRFDYCVTNTALDQAVSELETIFKREGRQKTWGR